MDSPATHNINDLSDKHLPSVDLAWDKMKELLDAEMPAANVDNVSRRFSSYAFFKIMSLSVFLINLCSLCFLFTMRDTAVSDHSRKISPVQRFAQGRAPVRRPEPRRQGPPQARIKVYIADSGQVTKFRIHADLSKFPKTDGLFNGQYVQRKERDHSWANAVYRPKIWLHEKTVNHKQALKAQRRGTGKTRKINDASTKETALMTSRAWLPQREKRQVPSSALSEIGSHFVLFTDHLLIPPRLLERLPDADSRSIVPKMIDRHTVRASGKISWGIKEQLALPLYQPTLYFKGSAGNGFDYTAFVPGFWLQRPFGQHMLGISIMPFNSGAVKGTPYSSRDSIVAGGGGLRDTGLVNISEHLLKVYGVNGELSLGRKFSNALSASLVVQPFYFLNGLTEARTVLKHNGKPIVDDYKNTETTQLKSLKRLQWNGGVSTSYQLNRLIFGAQLLVPLTNISVSNPDLKLKMRGLVYICLVLGK